MQCRDIIEHLEQLSPVSFASDWDNVGLLAGRREKEVQRIFIALDATDEIVDEAVRVDADMLLTHHPLIFKGIKNVSDSDFIGRRILRLIRYDISYYAMHTNFDVMGMADAAADEMKLEHREVLDVTYEDDLSREGIGRIGDLPSKMSLIECARYVKECFHIGNVRMYGDPAKKIKRVAICPGSGSDVIQNAIDKKVDVLITGDIGHHDGIDAVACGLPVIDASHYGLEKIFIPYMRDFLHRELPGLEVMCAEYKPPYQDI
ncbi:MULTISPECIES: Nif3-like dinuclear metal center hexameric protein [Butyrivibrio]|jgi:dinuclear metal center YbgI/SA1388 family protein|uniref:GTP cyclohydrolase 1 type 2 homolog n=1 Tax=Butyrivibrio fibrisolvens TaxID=831 RepID=A0A1H9X5G2_BUTFI|nr:MULTISPECIES: Nif3-like dinuclear metal center hexameric protein [Butyrivibrio]MCR4637015.1 Nif3-like dinuclear metal center hexameric protein [Butyrivibrio sp.]PWT29069.1 Nif3-like dinuclear metal center hexameric protein [Butyrivibrio fibrisolvens]SEP75227.1 dinuclear metal center protein, YbgI/SA1388 family [Butyrivibrio sp. TB]SES41390.1 dinuclear metal center protein, YbgI/SA1388 family [Butyrivibrio fibrisolvens]